MSEKIDQKEELENGKITLTKEEVNKSWYSWFKYCLTVFGYERLQAPGFILSMLPIFKKFYGNDPEKMVKRLKCHAVFYNTNPVFGAVVNGIVASMEVERGNGTEMTDEFINSIKVGLMGPLAGIGDSLIVGTLIPILLGIAIGLAEGGSVVGPIFYIVVWNAIITWFQKWIYNKGYELGGSAVEVIVGEQATALRESVIVMGQVVVGAMAASWIGLQTKIKIADDSEGNPVTLQSKLDGALPKVLPLCFVLLCWWLMAKKGISAIKILLLMIIVGIAGTLIGFFGTPPAPKA